MGGEEAEVLREPGQSHVPEKKGERDEGHQETAAK